jgi:hypothetical protein
MTVVEELVGQVQNLGSRSIHIVGHSADIRGLALGVSAGSAQLLEKVTLFLSLVIPARGLSRST